MQAIVKNSLDQIRLLCKKYHVKSIYLFGSATTESKFRAESDIDFLVNFSKMPSEKYGDNFFDFKFELENLLNRKIDLVTEKYLVNPYLIQSINNQRVLLYERRGKK